MLLLAQPQIFRFFVTTEALPAEQPEGSQLAKPFI